jgi:hypothetical protein
VSTGTAQRIFPGLSVTQFDISRDGKRMLFATEEAPGSGIWIADLDRVQPPRQLTFGSEYRAFFGAHGDIIYQGAQTPRLLMRMKEDGTEQRQISSEPIMQLLHVSPDGLWAAIGIVPPGGHGDRVITAAAQSLDGRERFQMCDACTFGFGIARMGAPVVQWSQDGKWIYVQLKYVASGPRQTAVLPVRSDASLKTTFSGVRSADDLKKIAGVRVLPADDVFPLTGPDVYVSQRKSAKSNLFRIYLH